MTGPDAAWRDPLDVVAGWESAVDPALLRYRVQGPFWDLLDSLDVTLLVTREYEHLLLAVAGAGGRGALTHLPLPHPSGVAFDATRGVVHVASTRNPNQVHDLVPVNAPGEGDGAGPLVPVRSRTLPGRLYLHDLAMVGGRLSANAVGENSVGTIRSDGSYQRAWWPECLDDRDDAFTVNHLQVNSIAAGRSLRTSYFTASTEAPGRRRPGHRDFPVDGRGVVFSGASRAPIARGLTRPHSARFLDRTHLLVANSGYGEVVRVDTHSGDLTRIATLPGWTRGVAACGAMAFVGTSRVLPRFERYAPGLDPDRCICGVHAVDLGSGQVVASLHWPAGDQLFAIEPVPSGLTSGLPAGPGRGAARRRALFYDFSVKGPAET